MNRKIMGKMRLTFIKTITKYTKDGEDKRTVWRIASRELKKQMMKRDMFTNHIGFLNNFDEYLLLEKKHPSYTI